LNGKLTITLPFSGTAIAVTKLKTRAASVTAPDFKFAAVMGDRPPVSVTKLPPRGDAAMLEPALSMVILVDFVDAVTEKEEDAARSAGPLELETAKSLEPLLPVASPAEDAGQEAVGVLHEIWGSLEKMPLEQVQTVEKHGSCTRFRTTAL
jgi:hypothetical protein